MPGSRPFIGITFLCLIAAAVSIAADEQRNSDPGRPGDDRVIGALEHVGAFTEDDLRAPTSVAVSPDGKFLYVSAFQSASHIVFRQDATTGDLEHVQTIVDPALLLGATALRLSPDGEMAAAAAFQSSAVVLYGRDSATGKLTKLDSKTDDDLQERSLGFAIDAIFSPDGRFVYVLNALGAVVPFEIIGKGQNRQLSLKTPLVSRDLRNVRSLAFHRSGETAFATGAQADTLVVLGRDAESGELTIRQVVRDGEGTIEGLDGAFGVAVSPDGKFVYSISGRFDGDTAVGTYRIEAPLGTLAPVQEIIRNPSDPDDPLRNFEGGNEIAVSPDGRNVYVVATRSGAVATFSREASNGKLTLLGVFHDEEAVAGAAGVAISPNGRFVYVAAESSDAVSVFRRHTAAEQSDLRERAPEERENQ